MRRLDPALDPGPVMDTRRAAAMLYGPCGPGQMTYGRRPRGPVRRLDQLRPLHPHLDAIRVAVCWTKFCNRLLRPLLAADQPQALCRTPRHRRARRQLHQPSPIRATTRGS